MKDNKIRKGCPKCGNLYLTRKVVGNELYCLKCDAYYSPDELRQYRFNKRNKKYDAI